MEGKPLIVIVSVLLFVCVRGDSTCNFEVDMCGWVNDNSTALKWQRHRGETPTESTGPSEDHTLKTGNGWYVYVDVSTAGRSTARLISPVLKQVVCLRFFYHMFGVNVGSLDAATKRINSRSKERIFFTRSQSQGNRWKEAVVTLSVSSTSEKQGYQIYLIARHTDYQNYKGDIAVDDITITDGKCNILPGEKHDLCTFDNGDDCFFGIVGDRYLEWQLKRPDKRAPNLAPPTDHTLGTKAGGFFHLVGDGPAVITTPAYTDSGKSKCIHFYYQFRNSDPGWFSSSGDSPTLSLYLHDVSQEISDVQIWKRSTAKNDVWLYGEASFTPMVDEYEIYFEGVVKKPWIGENTAVSFDDVQIVDGQCPEAGFCDFEEDMCTWTDGEGDIQFLRNNGRGSGTEKGPPKDKTKGTSDGFSVFINRRGKQLGSRAILESEVFLPSETGQCLHFWYYLERKDVGTLMVKRREENKTETIWKISGHQNNDWLKGQVPFLSNNVTHQVLFEGVTGKGRKGVIAIDDIRLNKDHDCDVTPFEADTRIEVLGAANCSFDDNNFCLWNNSVGPDETQWNFANGTESSSTGPTDTATGKGLYIHIKSSASEKEVSSASIVSPVIEAANIKTACFRFYYHMFGAHVNELTAYLIPMESEQVSREPVVLLRKNGTQPDRWILFQETLEPTQPFLRLKIEAQPGKYFAGDIAIDEVSLGVGNCAEKEVCDFETGLCGWTIEPSSDNLYQWVRGKSMGAKGPLSDHTTQSESGYYLQAVATDKATTGSVTNFVSPRFPPTSGSHCLTFWYFRRGYGTGVLSVKLRKQTNEDANLLYESGTDVGSLWKFARVSISAKFSFQVIVEAMKGPKSTYEIAIDDVRLSPRQCEDPGSCRFETDYCGYSNTGQFPWLLGKGRVLNSRLVETPDSDPKTPNGMFVYTDLTVPALAAGSTARLMSEILDSTEESCVTFWYYMVNSGNDTLSVKTSVMENGLNGTEGTETAIQTWTNTSAKWVLQAVPLKQIYLTFQLIFEVRKGSGQRSFVAVDDIDVRSGPCTAPTIEPPTTPSYVSNISCNFDDGTWCGWKSYSNRTSSEWKINDVTDKMDTLPKYDHTTRTYAGRFIYLYSEKKTSGSIVSPDFTADKKFCVSFWYNMISEVSSSLSVNVLKMTPWDRKIVPVWRRTGSYGQRWRHAYAFVTGNSSTFQVHFTAEVEEGAVAVDDVVATDGKCPSPKECTFDDNESCGYSQDSGEMYWKVSSGEDSEVLHKIYDHTMKLPQGKFFYLLINNTEAVPNQRVRLFSPPYQTAEMSCITFWYHMYKVEEVALNVYAYTKTGYGDTLWNVGVDQGPLWHGARFPVAPGTLSWQIAFEVVINSNKTGQLALDDIDITTGECPPAGHCNFESDKCLWENLFVPESQEVSFAPAVSHVPMVYDDFNWVPSLAGYAYGPATDHTTGTSEGFYLLLDARHQKFEDRAVYMSERLQTAGQVCFGFWYILPVPTNGSTIKLFQSTDYKDAGLIKTWNPSDGEDWKEVRLNITANKPEYQKSTNLWLYLVGYVGKTKRGYAAIDDITFSEGPCPYSDTKKDELFDCGNGEHVLWTDVCNFKEDCHNGADEDVCGQCDFEKDFCGWTRQKSASLNIDWERYRNHPNGPDTDTTKGDKTGFYAFSSVAFQQFKVRSALLFSPELYNSYSGCVMDFYYSVNGDARLYIDVAVGSQNFSTWMTRSELPQREWLKGSAPIGRVASSFKLVLHSEHAVRKESFIAVDDITTQNCALPSKSDICADNQFTCKNKVCVSKDRLCDYSDDCGDNSDEIDADCRSYPYRCSFTLSFCEWNHLDDSDSVWARTPPFSSLLRGPMRDHTTGTNNGMFLYLAGRQIPKPARLEGPTFQPSKKCQMTFYYDMRGTDLIYLQVKTRYTLGGRENIVFSKEEETGSYTFIRHIVPFNEKQNFQVIIEGKVKMSSGASSFIALDDISFTPDCVKLTTPLPVEPPSPTTTARPVVCNETQFHCLSSEMCIDESQVCDFESQCPDDSDEYRCGQCDFMDDMCGYKDTESGSIFEWKRVRADTFAKENENTTLPNTDSIGDPNGWFVVLSSGTAQFVEEAILKSPSFKATEYSCTVQFDYHFDIPYGYLELYVGDPRGKSYSRSLLKIDQTRRGKGWQHVSIPIGNWPAGRWIEFRGKATDIWRETKPVYTDIAVDNINFVNCKPGQSSKRTLNCTFDNDQCGWYPDNQNSGINWKRVKTTSGTLWKDHTTGKGYFMTLTTTYGTGQKGRGFLASLLQPPTKGRCCSFWFYIRGPSAGFLSVVIRKPDGTNSTIWTRSEEQGTRWIYGERTIRSDTQYSIIFEGSLAWGYSNVIALDDIFIYEEPCPHPVTCDFEADLCDWTAKGWGRELGKNNTPSKDHSTETETGYFVKLQENTGTLSSHKYGSSPGDRCLKFWYFLQGTSQESLTVNMVSNDVKQPTLWADVGEEGDDGMWRHEMVTVSTQTENFQIVFTGGRSDDNAVVALDDVRVANETCPPPGSCTFEEDMCTWRNLPRPYSSGANWVRTTGNTTANYGNNAITSDHTTGTPLGWYLIQSKTYGGTAVLASEVLHYKTPCFIFWYTLSSTINNNLDVMVKDHRTGKIQTIHSVRDGQLEWVEFKKPLQELPDTYEFHIAGTVGYNGRMALDDIFIQPDSCDDVTTDIPTTQPPSSEWDCTFEQGTLCSWNGTQAWFAKQARRAVMDNKGPHTDYLGSSLGRYAYFNPKESVLEGDLVSKTLPTDTNDNCVKFWYYMYSPQPISFGIHYLQGSQQSLPQWMKKDTSGLGWQYGSLYISTKPSNLSVVFKVNRIVPGVGDVAIDDISVSQGYCPLKHNVPCDFESEDICGFSTESDDFITWKRQRGRSKVYENKPDTDHTYGTADGYYMIMPASDGGRAFTNKAYLIIRNVDPSNAMCLKFWYQKRGVQALKLNIYSRIVGGSLGDPLATYDERNASRWRVGRVTITSLFKHEIVFEAVVQRGNQGFFALDDVMVQDGACSMPASCNFEKDLCTWSNRKDGVGLEWIRNSGPTRTPGTGPDVDHTLQTRQGTYIYLQAANSENKRNLIGILDSELLPLSTNSCLSFWVHMKGSDMGTLTVNLTSYLEHMDTPTKSVIFTHEGEMGDSWFNPMVDITAYNPNLQNDYQLALFGMTKGNLSDIAVDDIELLSTSCPAPQNESFYCNTEDEYIPLSKVCDFEKDCPNNADEARCGSCDFEHSNCSWTNFIESPYGTSKGRWIRAQALSDRSKLKSVMGDHTTNTSSGWFMFCDSNSLQYYAPIILRSPDGVYRFKKSFGSCMMKFWYYTVGYNVGPLRVRKVLKNGYGSLWEINGAQGPRWNLATVFLGTINGEFNIDILSHSSYGDKSVAAVDDISFQNCSLPPPEYTCLRDTIKCKYTNICISQDYLCDLSNDCGDGYDESEEVCKEYPKPCTFEVNGDCEWNYTSPAAEKNKWKIRRSESRRGSRNSGPINDHTKGLDSSGSYLVLQRASMKGRQNDAARIYSPNYVVDGEGPCVLRFYYYLFGEHLGSLKVYAEYEDKGWNWAPLWSKEGSMGQVWERAIVKMKAGDPFHFIIEGTLGNGTFSDIAVDDISIVPSCQGYNGTLPTPKPTPRPTESPCDAKFQFQCGDGSCIPLDKVCDFVADCEDASDEDTCGPCDFEHGMCGWKDESSGWVAWFRQKPSLVKAIGAAEGDHTTNSSEGFYLHTGRNGGFSVQTANVISPPLPQISSHCEVSFWYFVNNRLSGTLSVSHKTNSSSSIYITLWRTSKSTYGTWKRQEAKIPETYPGSLLRFQTTINRITSFFAIDDIAFINCNPKYLTIDCNFDDDFCFWKQPENAPLKWQRGSGITAVNFTGPTSDHTTGKGSYIYIDQRKQLFSRNVRLRCPTQSVNSPRGECFSFWYHMYGEHIGTLSVEMYSPPSSETLWERKRDQGKGWLHGYVYINSTKSFQLFLTATSSVGDQGAIAVDDVKMTDGPCPKTTVCDFEEDFCGWDPSYNGLAGWTRSQGTGNFSDDRPNVDHTSRTKFGHFVYLPSKRYGDIASLSSPYYNNIGSSCLQIWYMFGSDVSVLNVYQRTDDELRLKNKIPLWTRTGSHDGMWLRAQVSFEPLTKYYIVIEGQIVKSSPGFLALDDIYLLDGTCSDSGSCDFEKDSCGWTTYEGTPDMDWIRRTGADTTLGKGPVLDHTTYSVQGHYAYAYLKGLHANTEGLFISEDIEPADNYCFSCWYNMYNVVNSSLNVQEVIMGTNFQTLLGIDPPKVGSQVWNYTEVDIAKPNNKEYLTLGIRVVVHSNQDSTTDRGIAIDDITVTKYPCDLTTVSPTIATDEPSTYPPSNYDCNFEYGMCGWENDEDLGDFQWIIKTGHNDKTLKRARVDHTTLSTEGHYIAPNDNVKRMYGRFARLLSKNIVDYTPEGVCIKFWYYAYDTTKTLRLKIQDIDKNTYKEIWSKSYGKEPNWVYEQIHVNETISYRFSFEGDGGAYDGEMALDDISLNTGFCPPREICDFEQDKCGFTNDPEGDFMWTFGNGATVVSGPKTDHTLGSKLGNYFYIDGGLNLQEGATARIDSGVFQPDKTCIRFYYYLSGQGAGTLKVILKYGDNKIPLWSEAGDEGPLWHGTQLLASSPLPYQFTYEAIVGQNITNGSIAIDDISVLESCPDLGSCNFEENMCMYENDIGDSSYKTWLRGAKVMEVSSLMPSVDTTFGSPFGMYVFSYSQKRSKSAISRLLSPYLTSNKQRCLEFWHFRSGTPFPVFSVLKATHSGDPKQLFILHQETSNKWQLSNITFNSTDIDDSQKYRFIFQTNFTTASDQLVAIDDIATLDGACSRNDPEIPVFSCDGDKVHLTASQLCDFYKDCEDGTDESNCGTECDFETDLCNWKLKDLYFSKWRLTKVTPTLLPNTDHTFLEKGKGSYLKLTVNYNSAFATAISPFMTQAAPPCKMMFWYYMDNAKILLNVEHRLSHQSDSTAAFNLKGSQGPLWHQATVALGRLNGQFEVRIGGAATAGNLAIDDITFEDCAIPRPEDNVVCAEDEFRCERGHCIPFDLVCDFSDDCGDYSDESPIGAANCAEFKGRCDFEQGYCDWSDLEGSDFKWKTISNRDFTFSNHYLRRDHTLNSKFGTSLHIPYQRNSEGKAGHIVSPVMQKVGSTCNFHFFYTFSTYFTTTKYETYKNIGALTVYSRQNLEGVWRTEWSTSRAFGQYYERASVDLSHSDEPFEVIIEASVGGSSDSSWVIDDVSFSEGCGLYNGSLPDVGPTVIVPPTPCNEDQFTCDNGKCINKYYVCDFVDDCDDKSDEVKCGTCSFDDDANPTCGWHDMSSGRWIRTKDLSPLPQVDVSKNGYFMAVSRKPNGLTTGKAVLKSPTFQFGAASCQLEFYYFMSQVELRDTSLSLRLYTENNPSPIRLWSNNTNTGQWQNTTVGIGRKDENWWLEFVANHIMSSGNVAIDEVRFTGCHPSTLGRCKDDEFECREGGCVDNSLVCDFNKDCIEGSDEENCTSYPERCDFEDGLCNWTHDNKPTTLKWTVFSGKTLSEDTGPDRDHTFNNQTGHYLYLPSSSTSGGTASIMSTVFHSSTSGDCSMRFWYHMFGEHISSLAVLVQGVTWKQRDQLMKISGNQGDVWRRATVKLTNKQDLFEVVIQGTRGTGAKGEIAIDDISFTPNCLPKYSIVTTPIPTKLPTGTCEAIGQFSCEDNSCIPFSSLCDFRADCPSGEDESGCPPLCTFEDGTTCGWTNKTGPIQIISGSETETIMPIAPDIDSTTNTSSGHYLLLHSGNKIPFNIQSQTFRNASSTCKLRFWYAATMDSSVILNTTEMPPIKFMEYSHGSSESEWRRVVVGLGRREQPFYISFQGQSPGSKLSFFAVDDLEFYECSLPSPNQMDCVFPTHFLCRGTHACIKSNRVCDLTDDCGDGSDERDCESKGFNLIDFEDDFGILVTDLEADDVAKWTVKTGPVSIPLKTLGPLFDHTYSNSSGKYLYLSESQGRYGQKAQLISETMKSSGGKCTVRFYYHMFGKYVNRLSVYTQMFSNEEPSPVWWKIGQEGNYWKRGDVAINSPQPFRFIIEGQLGKVDSEGSDGIGLDDFSFTENCIVLTGETLPPLPTTTSTTTTTAATSTPRPTESTAKPTTTTIGPTSPCPPGHFQCVADHVCIEDTKRCDFRMDCSDNSDESTCVQQKCDFEKGHSCGWIIYDKSQSFAPAERRRRSSGDKFEWTIIRADYSNTTVPTKYRPNRDHTYNSSEGWYILADGVPSTTGDTTELITPIISATDAKCAVDFWFASGSMAFNMTVSVEEEGDDYKRTLTRLWSPKVTNYKFDASTWNHAKVRLGRTTKFRVKFAATRPPSYNMTVSLDDITFQGCPPPTRPVTPDNKCSSDMFKCDSGLCVGKTALCDFQNDCGDSSDESLLVCGAYKICTFETETCSFWNVEGNLNEWTKEAPSTHKNSHLPSRDHTKSDGTGNFLSAMHNTLARPNTSPPRFYSHAIHANSKDCTVNFWYNIIGKGHVLNVYRRTSYGDGGMQIIQSFGNDGVHDFWEKAVVFVNQNSSSNQDFEVVFEAAFSMFPGSVNVDALSMHPYCQEAENDIPGKPTKEPPVGVCGPEKFTCDNGNCYTHLQRCDFVDDCGDGTDEEECGKSCTFERDECGWFNSYGYSSKWKRGTGDDMFNTDSGPSADHTYGNISGHFLYTGGSGWNRTGQIAILLTNPYTISGPNCLLSFWYHMSGQSIGKLSVRSESSSVSVKAKFTEHWTQEGDQGKQWKKAEVKLSEQRNFSLIIQGTRGSSHASVMAIDDLEFKDCMPGSPPVECASYERTCKKIPQCIEDWEVCDGKIDCMDNTDEDNCESNSGDCDFDDSDWLMTCKWVHMPADFRWTTASSSSSDMTGPDSHHNSYKTGKYLFINSALQTEGKKAIVGTPVFPASTGKCHVRFWYYMYGSDKIGPLELYSYGVSGQEVFLWQTAKNSGKKWIYHHSLVGNSEDYQVLFLAFRGGDRFTDIAIDDVRFTSGCQEKGDLVVTGKPPACVDGQFRCQSGHCIPGDWRCNCFYNCKDGSDEDGCAEHCESEGITKGTSPMTTITTQKGTPPTTPVPEVQCKSAWMKCGDGSCIPRLLRCDTVKDCPDGEDEQNCPKMPCGEGFFYCKGSDTECVLAKSICDGKKDCYDNSDESFCEGSCAVNSSSKGFCLNGGYCRVDGNSPKCICRQGYGGNRCETFNGTPTGVTGETTVSTPWTPIPTGNCDEGWVSCGDEKCIPGILLCDGVNDCGNGLDEWSGCPGIPCGEEYYFCNSAPNKCLPRWTLCNGKRDCGDYSDESFCGACDYTMSSTVYCQNGGNCTLKQRVPICQCSEKYEGNRCTFNKVTEPEPDERQKATTNHGWVAGVVIGTLLLIAIVGLVWYRRRSALTGQRMTHALDNPVYGLNMESVDFAKVSYELSKNKDGTFSPTSIENPLYGRTIDEVY